MTWACCIHSDQPKKLLSNDDLVFLFVCVEVLQPSQPNGVMSSAVSLPNHTFTGQLIPLLYCAHSVHILLPECDNCPS